MDIYREQDCHLKLNARTIRYCGTKMKSESVPTYCKFFQTNIK
jgi:hypothetical protein